MRNDLNDVRSILAKAEADIEQDSLDPNSLLDTLVQHFRPDSPDDIIAIVERLRDPEYDDFTEISIKVLVQRANSEIITILIKLLDDADVGRCWSAVEALGRIKDACAVEPIILLLQHSNWQIRKASANALGIFWDQRAVQPLLALLDDPVLDVQNSVIQALGCLGDVQVVQSLINLFNSMTLEEDEDGIVHEAIITTLGHLNNPTAHSFLREICQAESQYDDVLAWKSMVSLGQHRNTEDVPFLLNKLHHINSILRSAAAEALGLLGDVRAVPDLINSLSDDDPFVRIEAARSLARFKDPRAIPALRDLTSDAARPGFDRVGDVALQALNQVITAA